MPGLPRPISDLQGVDTVKPNDLFVLQRDDNPMSLSGDTLGRYIKNYNTPIDSTLTQHGFAADAYETGLAIKGLENEHNAFTGRVKSGTIHDAELHLGFYLDEDGDLCQMED